eukprot:NODE_85_length_22232_cov_1.318619.p20 type:complete len:165 gc:universal NODE_85_length_22232_cov_1.318619:3724-3230(-)
MNKLNIAAHPCVLYSLRMKPNTTTMLNKSNSIPKARAKWLYFADKHGVRKTTSTSRIRWSCNYCGSEIMHSSSSICYHLQFGCKQLDPDNKMEFLKTYKKPIPSHLRKLEKHRKISRVQDSEASKINKGVLPRKIRMENPNEIFGCANDKIDVRELKSIHFKAP